MSYSSNNPEMEDLFLEACLPLVQKRVLETYVQCCLGCRYNESHQTSHQCLLKPEDLRFVVDTSLIAKAVPLLAGDLPALLSEVYAILVNPDKSFPGITLRDFLDFYFERGELPPLARISYEYNWQTRLLALIRGPDYEEPVQCGQEIPTPELHFEPTIPLITLDESHPAPAENNNLSLETHDTVLLPPEESPAPETRNNSIPTITID